MKKTVIIIGHSHASCLKAALKKNIYCPRNPFIKFVPAAIGSRAFIGGLITFDAHGNMMPNPIIQKCISAHAKDNARDIWLLSVLGGNYSNRLGLFQDGPLYDINLPSQEFMENREETISELGAAHRAFVPYDAIINVYEKLYSEIKSLFKVLQQQRVKGIMHVSGPSPIPDETYIRENLPANLVKRARKIDPENELIINPISLRMKLWTCECDAVKKICKETSVHYIHQPEDAIGPDNFRKSETYADVLHGSPLYGAMALEKVETFLETYN